MGRQRGNPAVLAVTLMEGCPSQRDAGKVRMKAEGWISSCSCARACPASSSSTMVNSQPFESARTRMVSAGTSAVSLSGVGPIANSKPCPSRVAASGKLPSTSTRSWWDASCSSRMILRMSRNVRRLSPSRFPMASSTMRLVGSTAPAADDGILATSPVGTKAATNTHSHAVADFLPLNHLAWVACMSRNRKQN
jgi:hypothetical protein